MTIEACSDSYAEPLPESSRFEAESQQKEISTMSDNMKFNEYQNLKDYEKKIENLKTKTSHDFTQDELEEWKAWSEKWAEKND